MVKAKKRPKTRMFSGRRYWLHSGHKSRKGATQSAERLRREGYNARVIKDSVGSGWAAYRGLKKRERKISDKEAAAFFDV
jgi:hypothetical protein